MWNVDTGLLEGKISHSTEDSLTTVSWSPDGRKITCGGSRGKIFLTHVQVPNEQKKANHKRPLSNYYIGSGKSYPF